MVSQLKNVNSLNEEEGQCSLCECVSCKTGSRFKNWLPRWLIGGFLLPVLWFGNVAIYVYTQWLLDHEPTHAQLPPEEMPTVYEIQAKIEKTHLQLSKSVAEEIDRVNETTRVLDNLGGPEDNMQDHRKHFLKQVACAILDSHEAGRAHYRKWILRTALAIVAYSVTVLLLVTAYSAGH